MGSGGECRQHLIVNTISIHPSIKPPSIHSSLSHPSIHPFSIPFIQLSAQTSIQIIFQPSIHSYINPSVRPSIYRTIYPSIPSSARGLSSERSLMVQWVVGSILHGVDPLSYFLFQPVPHDWRNKGLGMYYPVCGMVHLKEPLLLIDKSSL